MAVKIRLRQQGRKNHLFYRVVVADSRSPRDGKYLECIGWYNPLGKENQTLQLDDGRVKHWLEMGAEPTEKTESLISTGAPEVMKWYREKQQKQRVKKAARHKKKK